MCHTRSQLTSYCCRLLIFRVLLTPCVFLIPLQSHANNLSIAIANSTCATMKTIGDTFMSRSDINIRYICKSSGMLAKGIEGGALEADIYISANQSWMEYLVEKEVVMPSQVTSEWGNKLVIATPSQSQFFVENLEDLQAEKIKTILIGDPSTAPFGGMRNRP